MKPASNRERNQASDYRERQARHSGTERKNKSYEDEEQTSSRVGRVGKWRNYHHQRHSKRVRI